MYEPSFDELLTMASNDEAYAAISAHFQRIYPGEVARGVNLIGPQRDDVSIELNGMPAREYSSNGESWTLALAMKMAVYRLLEQEHGERPIVVLDDVFAQLDPTRRAKIMEFAAKQDQVLITAAAQSDVPQFADANVIDVAHVAAQSDDDPLLKQAAQAAKRGSAA
ncbi:DNA recombination protein RecF [Bifidobacterium sp. GSD1FS]|uniref:DNA recombination protein RecF n=1 Tax=Bifidobacterium canis TaxID=2610880 RepID=A0A7K1J463_9BIFI|nr:DNA recombination protein RecF [Bifidobacterium canis]